MEYRSIAGIETTKIESFPLVPKPEVRSTTTGSRPRVIGEKYLTRGLSRKTRCKVQRSRILEFCV